MRTPTYRALSFPDAIARQQRLQQHGLERVPLDRMVEMVSETEGNISAAAARLDLSPSTVRHRLRRHGVEPRDFRPPRGGDH